MLTYHLEVTLCLLLFYTFYVLFLAKLSFYRLGRIYLLASLGLSLLIPALNIPTPQHTPILATKNLVRVIEEPEQNTRGLGIKTKKMAHPQESNTNPWLFYLGLGYGMGVILMSLRLVYGLVRVYRLARGGKWQEGFKIVHLEDQALNASFFQIIFINAEKLSTEEYQQVLQHEQAHYRCGHSWDVLLMACFQTIFWYNPIIFFYRKSLLMLHEYEVDEAMSQTYNRRSYAELLVKLSRSCSLGLGHSFGQHPVHQRVKRIFNPKSKPMKKLTYLLFLPLIAFACQQFALQEKVTSNAKLEAVDSLRTFGENLGENPLVIIDEKTYPASILKKIDPKKTSTSSSYPAYNPKAIGAYGLSAQEGVVVITTKNGDFLFDSYQAWYNAMRLKSIPKDRFFTRLTLMDEDGSQFDHVVIRLPDGSGGRLDGIKPGEDVLYLIDEQVYTEEDFSGLTSDQLEELGIVGLSITDRGKLDKNKSQKYQRDVYGSVQLTTRQYLDQVKKKTD